MGLFDGLRKAPARKSVLIVDDEDDYQRLALTLLGPLGVDLLMAKNGVEALALAKEKGPSLILLDIVMPIMDGLQALEMIRANPRTKSIPVIMLSSRQREYEVKRAYQLGVAGYIPKPYNNDVFVANIRAQLGIPDA